MASQSFNLQASGSSRSAVHPNPSGSQVDLTLRLGLSRESDKNIPHFGPMINPQHAHVNFTGPYTTQAINHFDMVRGRGNTTHNPWAPEMRSHYMNSNGLEQPQAAASIGGGPLFTNSYNYNIPPMPQMNEYTLLNPSSRRVDRGNGGSSSSRRTSRRQHEANYNDPSKRCTNYNCGTNNTPMWRKGPLGPKSLCNACGIKYRKEEEKRKARRAVENSGTSSRDKD